MGEYEKIIRQRYSDDFSSDKQKKGYPPIDGALKMLILAPAYYGVEEEMLKFLESNPNATSKEVYEYFYSITPPLEEVDDDELDEDERAD